MGEPLGGTGGGEKMGPGGVSVSYVGGGGSSSTFECGNGGEEELRRAYTDAVMYLDQNGDNDNGGGGGGGEEKDKGCMTITALLRHRTARNMGGGDKTKRRVLPNNVVVEDEVTQMPPIDTGMASTAPASL